MEKAILIADQLEGVPVAVCDAVEVDDNTGDPRVIQLVRGVARQVSEIFPARGSHITSPDSAENVDGWYPEVGGDSGGYLSSFRVWGRALHFAYVGSVLWWGVEYTGSQTIVRIYFEDPTGGGVSPIAVGSVSGRGGDVTVYPVGDYEISARVTVSDTVVTDDEEGGNTLTFPDWFMHRVWLGDGGEKIGIGLLVSDYVGFTSADITPIMVNAYGEVLAILETKHYSRGAVDFGNAEGNLLLPVQWWEVHGSETIAVHVTAIGGGGGIYPQIIRG